MAKKTSKTRTASKRTSTQSNASTSGIDRSFIQEFSLTGIMFPEVINILVTEVKKMPPNRASSVSKLTLDFNDRYVATARRYLEADRRGDTKSKRAIKQEEFTTECLFINNLMRLGCSNVLEKMQAEAEKHTKADKNGRKFNMFSVIRHNSIYYPSDIALMKSKGYDFNALHTINGQKKDFTTYNLELLNSSAERLEACSKGLYDSIRKVQEERNKMIEEYERLEAEKKKASATRKKAIEREIEELNKKFVELNREVDLYKAKGDVVIEEFIAARQRLLKAVELGVLSPENVAKIERANIPQIVENFQVPYARYMRLKQVIYKEDAVSYSENLEQQETKKGKVSPNKGANAVLAGAETYQLNENGPIEPLQLGRSIDVETNPQLAQIRVDNLGKV